jgi:hypothetical protein
MRVITRPGIGEAVASLACLAVVFAALIAIDDRVRERFVMLFGEASGDFGNRLRSLGDSVLQTARDQSIAQAPMLLFVVVAVVLLVFMLRT